MNNILEKINRKLVITTIIFLIPILGAIFFYKYYTDQNPHAQNPLKPAQLTEFGKEKYKLLPLMRVDDEYLNDTSTDSGKQIPSSFYYGKAKITYNPLDNTFSGYVDSAADLEEFRLEKQAIVRFLTGEKKVNVCDLKILWTRPTSVEKGTLETKDIASDGCLKDE